MDTPNYIAASHETIAAFARTLWETRGRPEGQDDEIWYKAERQLNTELAAFANAEKVEEASASASSSTTTASNVVSISFNKDSTAGKRRREPRRQAATEKALAG